LIKPSFISTSEILSGHSTLKVGGRADFFATIKSRDDLSQAVSFAKDNSLDVFTLGHGSNVLFSDRGFPGMILKINLEKISSLGNELEVEAGASVSTLVELGGKLGFAGFQNFAGLPGSVGGAICGNAGSFNAEFWDRVVCATFFDGENFFDLCPRDCKVPLYSYRSSVFKEHRDWIIVSARLSIGRKSCKLVREENLRIIKARAAKQPKGKSAGCIFKNPLLRGQKVSAGRLIDAVGLKGARIGGAEISDIHANFFLNGGNAVAGDFMELIKLARGKVFQEFGVLLEEEIVEVGEF
jgi:UDP-N-acetylmuramate dehydrogenase